MSDLLQNSTDDSMSNATDCQSLTDEWSSLCCSIMKLATESLGFSSKRHQDWFDDQRHDILSLLHEKNDARDALLHNPNSASLHQRWKELHNKVQTDLRQMENSWWTQKAEEIQRFADTNDTQKFYEALKTIYMVQLSTPYTR